MEPLIPWFIGFVLLMLAGQAASLYFYFKAQSHLTEKAEARYGRWKWVPRWAGLETFTPEGQRYWRLMRLCAFGPFAAWAIWMDVAVAIGLV
ncbi:MAG TPA: hypothetical protein VF761_00465 [Gemmatimonadaceae bacterium]